MENYLIIFSEKDDIAGCILLESYPNKAAMVITVKILAQYSTKNIIVFY